MERTKGVLPERIPQGFLLRRHPPAQISCELKLLASHKLISGYFHPTPNPSPFGEENRIVSKSHVTPRLLSPSGSPRLKGRPEGLGERLFALPVVCGSGCCDGREFLGCCGSSLQLLDLALRLVGVDRVEVRDPSQPAPSEFFPDVVRTPLGMEFDFVGLVGLVTCNRPSARPEL